MLGNAALNYCSCAASSKWAVPLLLREMHCKFQDSMNISTLRFELNYMHVCICCPTANVWIR